MDTKNKKHSSYNDEQDLSEARKRLHQMQGPSISFKRSRHHQTNHNGASSSAADLDADYILKSRNSSYTQSKSAGSRSINPISSPYGRCSNVSERYKKVARIGEGTYGIVYKAIDQQTNEYVALKRCLPHHQASDGFPITTLREIEMLREISSPVQNNSEEDNSVQSSHENIISLLEIAVGSKGSSVFLVFEYVHFDLAKLIDDHYAKYNRSPFTLPETKCLTRQLFSAIEFLHERWIIHRDLKLSNLLYDRDRGLLKLADFGLARKIEGGKKAGSVRQTLFPQTPPPILTPKVVSLWYRPPELLLNSEYYTVSIDQWAAGCVIAELLLGQPLFRGKDDLDQLQKIVDILGPPLVNEWPDLLEMPLVKSGSIELPFSLAADGNGSATRKQYVGPKIGRHSAKKLLDIFSNLSVSGIEILIHLLTYDPAERWTARQASNSSWLQENPKPTHPAFMPKFESKL